MSAKIQKPFHGSKNRRKKYFLMLNLLNGSTNYVDVYHQTGKLQKNVFSVQFCDRCSHKIYFIWQKITFFSRAEKVMQLKTNWFVFVWTFGEFLMCGRKRKHFGDQGDTQVLRLKFFIAIKIGWNRSLSKFEIFRFGDFVATWAGKFQADSTRELLNPNFNCWELFMITFEVIFNFSLP